MAKTSSKSFWNSVMGMGHITHTHGRIIRNVNMGEKWRIFRAVKRAFATNGAQIGFFSCGGR